MKQVASLMPGQAHQVANQPILSQSNSPVNREISASQQKYMSNNSERRAPIKAFPTPSNAIGNILGFNSKSGSPEPAALSPQQQKHADIHKAATQEAESQMKDFVTDFERATQAEKAHDQMLALKKIRLHHKVLSRMSFNAFKFIIDCASVHRVYEGEKLYAQGDEVAYIYFVLYGSLMVTIANSNRQRVGDVVRSGNVLGEEAFFCQSAVYKESATCEGEEVGLLAVDAQMLSNLGSTNFQGKGQNMLAYQRDFKALFAIFKQVHLTKEGWRGRAMGILQQ